MYPTVVPSVPRHYGRRPRAQSSLSVAIVRTVHPFLVELVVNNAVLVDNLWCSVERLQSAWKTVPMPWTIRSLHYQEAGVVEYHALTTGHQGTYCPTF